ncbi:Spindle and kinetochore-associated protein 1-like [Porphyridium purpureum]|uniref:Spindle and kinetochore-associated protein 1-like n=1 Tax=Porphyridium purpureum TaxID=35688 RepID=A0A5J4YXE9_PORPP|nr:Spindle and kinetochore-associated protein 1-like [Porphyridium purpureum]|eukprot:POR2501..scf209_3
MMFRVCARTESLAQILAPSQSVGSLAWCQEGTKNSAAGDDTMMAAASVNGEILSQLLQRSMQDYHIKAEEIQLLCELKAASSSEDTKPDVRNHDQAGKDALSLVLQELATDVGRLEYALNEVEKFAKEERAALHEHRALVAVILEQEKSVEYAEKHLPEQYKAKLRTKHRISSEPAKKVLESQPDPVAQGDARAHITDASSNSSSKPPSASAPAAPPGYRSRQERVKEAMLGGSAAGPNGSVPSIAWIKEHEFEGVPSYRRGRMTLDRVNVAVDEINAMLQEKYELLQKPARELSSEQLDNMQKYEAWSKEKEVQGKFFFADAEVKQRHGRFKLDSNGKVVLEILRAVGRLTVTRGDKGVRLFILSST